MRKLLCVCALAALCLMLLAGCQCEHVFADADCLTPKTCTECGETEGEALGHDWVEADCVTPKTCSRCKATEGDVAEHTWVDASCAAPKTCSVCGETEGEALEHTWVDATTSAPKTCSGCGLTEGERIVTDERFTTEACSSLFGNWICEMESTAAQLGYSDSDVSIKYTITYFFSNDGHLHQETTYDDPAAVEAVLLDYMKRLMYAQFEGMGLSEADIDAAFMSEMGISLEDYFKASIAEMNITEAVEYDCVYYVEGDNLYVSVDWDQYMTPFGLSVEGDVMSLTYEDGHVEVYNRIVG